MTNHKEIVDQIFIEKAKNDSNSRDLARTLNVLSKTVFGDLNRFVFELLQNADDSSQSGQQIDVQFILLDNYLIFSHSGSHFTAEDVVGISGIGNRASEKDKQAEKIGYKGIGFKSVFGSSDYAHIVSGGFSFRFDKNCDYYHRSGGADNFPWQVIPIWTEHLPAETTSFIDASRVNTIIGIRDKHVVHAEIMKTFKDSQILLFLRKVTSVSFFDGANKVFKFEKKVAAGAISIFNDDVLVSRWLTKDFILQIDQNLHDKLNELSDTECPQKLKEASITKLTFAAQIEDNQFVPIRSAVIYSYLPTKSAMGFAYLVNGDFLTNAERTELMQNVWNKFLLKQIAIKQIEWFNELQQGDSKFKVLQLLRGKFSTFQISEVQASYNTGLEEASRTIPFLPVQSDSTKLVTIANSIVDSPKFSSIFAPSIISSYLRKPAFSILDIHLENQSAISGLGATIFTIDDLLQLIPSGYISGNNAGINVIVFFYNSTFKNSNHPWLLKLRENAFLMDEAGYFRTPKEIFIPAEGTNQTGDNEFASLNFIHNAILVHFRDSPDVIQWLFNLGVRQPTDLEIFRKSIIPLIAHGKVQQGNIIVITRFIFKVFKSRQLSDADYDGLKQLHVLSTKGLIKASHCYFSDEYKPEKSLSAIIPEAHFLSADYIEQNEDVAEWKAFFKKIGVRENLTIDIIEEKIERGKLESQYPESKRYCSWLEENYVDGIYHRYRYSNQHYVQGYTVVVFREHLSEPTFSKSFWTKTLDNWQDFGPKYSGTIYYYYGGNVSVPSFIQYYAQNYASVKCTDGLCRKSTDIFSPSLKSIIGDLLPVADLPPVITKDQADFFGFKREISVPECLDLLTTISLLTTSADLTKQLFNIYDYFISLSGDKTETSKAAVSNFYESGVMLATNNTFQPVKQLYCFAVTGINTPANSARFIKLRANLAFAEIEALCNYLNIPVITFTDLKFVPDNAASDLKLKEILLAKAKFVALMYSQQFSENYVHVYSHLRKALESMQFMAADSLSLVYQNALDEVIFNSKIASWREGDYFYYINKWNSPLAIYELSSSLCAHLGLKETERELGLILQLPEPEIIEWLLEKGYELDNVLTDELYFQDVLPPSQELENVADALDFEIVANDVFEEKVKLADINFSNVVPIATDYSRSYTPAGNSHATIANQQVKVDVGRWAEEYVFKYLKANTQVYSEIKWMNEDKESYLPYDFEVIENGSPLFIEVKGTTSVSKEIIYLSADEWRILFQKAANYAIFRILGVGTEKHVLERTNNLKALIEDAKLMTFPIEITLP